uniref:Wings apart-like protein C-terminal domain-containing protein n=1 Tax=Quercus lobata TaxID=97700 RepID=A0A7N2N1V4_QUELO
MEAQEFGEMIMEHVDEVNFALDGLRKPQPVRIRRASLLSICATCTAETPLADSRRNLIYAASQGAEEAFKKTVEVDRLMDTLRDANPNQLQKLVVENVLAFNEGFWIHLAARTDTCKSEDDKACLFT